MTLPFIVAVVSQNKRQDLGSISHRHDAKVPLIWFACFIKKQRSAGLQGFGILTQENTARHVNIIFGMLSRHKQHQHKIVVFDAASESKHWLNFGFF